VSDEQKAGGPAQGHQDLNRRRGQLRVERAGVLHFCWQAMPDMLCQQLWIVALADLQTTQRPEPIEMEPGEATPVAEVTIC
jgi:hypothetical protein